MTVQGGEPLIDWDELAPLIEHPARESIVEALRWIGPLSALGLKGVLDDRKIHLSYIAYHLQTLVWGEVLREIGRRRLGPKTFEAYFYFELEQ